MFISMSSPCFCDKPHVIVFSWMWCMNISSFGLRDCMLMSAILSPVKFQNVLSDLSCGFNS